MGVGFTEKAGCNVPLGAKKRPWAREARSGDPLFQGLKTSSLDLVVGEFGEEGARQAPAARLGALDGFIWLVLDSHRSCFALVARRRPVREVGAGCLACADIERRETSASG